MTQTRKHRNRKRFRIKTHKHSKQHTNLNKYKDITANISIKNFSHNLNILRNLAKTDIMPVLKANAYGHGIIDMAKIVRKMKIKYIGVATIGEAIQIRNSGDNGRIVCWIYDVHGPEVQEAIYKNIDFAIFDENHIDIISDKIPKNSHIKVHLFVDTGINRNGIPYDKSFDAAIKISANSKFEMVGLMSHLCCSDEKINNTPTMKQLTIFRELRKQLLDNNINPELVHIGNTDAILNYDLSDFTLSRSGYGVYGYGEKLIGKHNLIPIMDVKSSIIQIKRINKGDGVGYNRTFIAPKDMFIAIVPIGYADFIPWTKTGTLSVKVNGTRRKIIGTESMDQMVIEANKNDKIGDDVKLFGNPRKGYIPLNEYASKSKTVGTTILTHIGERVNHKYK